jgi:hypothetical protein
VASTTSKRRALSRSVSHASPKNTTGLSDHAASKMESREPEDAAAEEQPLVSLKEVYVDMIRNQQLDYENFLEPNTIANFHQEKLDSSLKVVTRHKYKRKIWKPNYQQIIPKKIKILCDANPGL